MEQAGFDVKIREISFGDYEVLVNGKRAQDFRTATCSRRIYVWEDETGKEYLIKLDSLRPSISNRDFDSQSSCELDVYQIIEDEDRKYFPEIVAGRQATDTEIGFVMEPLYEFVTPSLESVAIVERLCEKYGLEDVATDLEWDEYEILGINWGETYEGHPIIYDFAL